MSSRALLPLQALGVSPLAPSSSREPREALDLWRCHAGLCLCLFGVTPLRASGSQVSLSHRKEPECRMSGSL